MNIFCRITRFIRQRCTTFIKKLSWALEANGTTETKSTRCGHAVGQLDLAHNCRNRLYIAQLCGSVWRTLGFDELRFAPHSFVQVGLQFPPVLRVKPEETKF